MKYIRVEVEMVDAWKVNKHDVEYATYPDFIKDAVDRGDIVFHSSLSNTEKDLILAFVLCNDNISHCTGTGSYIVFSYDKGFRIISNIEFETRFQPMIEGDNGETYIEEERQYPRITVLPKD